MDAGAGTTTMIRSVISGRVEMSGEMMIIDNNGQHQSVVLCQLDSINMID